MTIRICSTKFGENDEKAFLNLPTRYPQLKNHSLRHEGGRNVIDVDDLFALTKELDHELILTLEGYIEIYDDWRE